MSRTEKTSVERDTLERARAAVYWLRVPGTRLEGITLEDIVTRGTLRVVRELERKHNDGRPFKRLGKGLPRGRIRKR